MVLVVDTETREEATLILAFIPLKYEEVGILIEVDEEE